MATLTYTAVAECVSQAEVDALVAGLNIVDPTSVPSTYVVDGLTVTISFDSVEANVGLV